MEFFERLKFRCVSRYEIFKQVVRMNCQYMVQAIRHMDIATLRIWLRHCRNQIGVSNLERLSKFLLILALCFGMYTRWQFSSDRTMFILCLVGIVVFVIIFVAMYYFSLTTSASSLLRLWVCYYMGIIAFSEESQFRNNMLELSMNGLFICSLVTQFIASLFKHATSTEDDFKIFSLGEFLEILGMTIATITIASDMVALTLILISFGLTIIAIRLKSFVGLLNIFLLSIMTGVFVFPKLQIKLNTNSFCLSCFALKLLIDPLLQWVLCKNSVLNRWQNYLQMSVLFRHSSVLLFVAVEITYCIICALAIPNHKEWYIVIPIFMAAGTFWFLCHLIFIITCWQLMKKVTVCYTTFKYASDGSRNIHRIMESKGVRHFSLISQRLAFVTLLTSFLVAIVSWETRTALTLSMFLIVLPLEGLVLSLLLQLGSHLVGRCTGYAIVAPTLQHRLNGGATLIPEVLLQETRSRSMVILNTVERFFTHHMVHIFGCDYTSSGLTLDAVQLKLEAFFEKNTEDGPCYDTYILYYSGYSHDNGDWAFTGNEILPLETILRLWKEKKEHTGARLILILDTDNSHKWIRSVQRNAREMIAIQTCLYLSPINSEEGKISRIGDFTREWVVGNSASSEEMEGINWVEKGMRPEYGVSRRWSNFSFHLPTDDDISQHWRSNFPKLTQPLAMCISCSLLGSRFFCCCDCLVKCLKRKKMLWFPPRQLDTDHGFKLVRN